MTGAERVYSRACLKYMLADVLRHDPTINLKAAHVWKLQNGKYEFRYHEFCWVGSADGAIDARAAGWTAWLMEQIPGYAS